MTLTLKKIKFFLTCVIFSTFPIMSIVTYGAGSKLNMSLADIFVLLLGFVYLLDIKNFSLKRDFPFIWYFTALLLITFLSEFINMQTADVATVGYIGMATEVFKLATSGAYAFIAYNSIHNEEEQNKSFNIIVICWLIGLYICIIYGLYAHLSFVLRREFFNITKTLSYHNRFLGTQTDPNAAAFYLCVSFFIAILAAFYLFKSTKARVFLFITSILVFLCILLTMSRGGWVGFASGVAFLLMLNVRRIKNKKLLYIVPIIIAVIAVLVFIDERLMSGYVQNNLIRRADIFKTGGGTLESRVNLTMASLKMGLDHFLLGVGRGNFPLNSKEYIISMGIDWSGIYNQTIPHNTLAGMFAELGFIGASVFVSLFMILLIRTFKNKKYDFYFKSIIFALLVSVFVQSLALSLENTRTVWILVGLLLRLMTQTENTAETS